MEDVERLKAAYSDRLTFLDLTDFAETAAVLFGCDLVITADTSVAHMAGSLGIPTWIFIPKFSTDWRWQLGGRVDSPWYPSVSLYRQSEIGNWRPTLALAKQDLAARRDELGF
jgi:ADP-heptose:LPS heptosyltransferase